MVRLIRLATVGSTMDVMHDLAAAGAEAGAAVVAEQQIGGRGSRGRPWWSPPGGLWLSVLMRPRAAAGLELFGLRIGLAVAEAIESLHPGITIRIKWPNDLMIGERKLGGILCEARWQGDSLAWVVAGVGINVANPLSEDLADTAATLHQWIPGIAPAMVEPEVIARLRALAMSPERLGSAELSALRDRNWLEGRRLRAPVPGTAIGISEEGALLVTAEGGATVAVTAGTVELADRSLTP